VPVVGTTMTHVMAKVDVPISVGLNPANSNGGTLFAGQTAVVLGVTIDNAWWQVPCPGDGPTQCFVTADATQTEASTAPGI